MSVRTEELIRQIERFAPLRLQESWDNSGWQIDPGRAETERVLVALEITKAVIGEAKGLRADFILTHHPLLFVPVKRIAFNDVTGGYIAALIASGIGAYAAHTSFDSAPGGMNDSLAARIGLVNVAPLPSAAMREEGRDFGAGMMRCGAFDRPLTFREACRRVERVLGMEGRLRVVGDPDKPIERVALCGGGGGDLTEDAIRNDCQLYITGDVKHHQAQWAKESGMCLIDGGHDGTEKHFIEVAANRLREAFSGSLEIIETSVSADPYK